MQYVCDAPGRKAWFRIETEAEAFEESRAMRHAVEKYFRREEEKARASYVPPTPAGIERDIALKAHLRARMPLFLTLRDGEGSPLATAMLPPGGKDDAAFRIIIAGPDNADPFAAEAASIAVLAGHLGFALTRQRCFPYHS